MFQDHLVLMPYLNVKIFLEIKIIKAGLGSMCSVSRFQIFPSDNHRSSEGHVFVFSATVIERRRALAYQHATFLIILSIHLQMWIVTPDLCSLIKMANACGVQNRGPGCCLKMWSIITDWHSELNDTRMWKNRCLLGTRERKLGPRG